MTGKNLLEMLSQMTEEQLSHPVEIVHVQNYAKLETDESDWTTFIKNRESSDTPNTVIYGKFTDVDSIEYYFNEPTINIVVNN